MNADVRRIWGSYICFFTWYQVVICNFTYSPLRDLILSNAGLDSRTLLMFLNLALGASVPVSFFLVRGRDLQRNRMLWGALHLLDFCALLLIPAVKSYGQHHMRLHVALAVFFLAMALSETPASCVFNRYIAFSVRNFGLIYIIVVGLPIRHILDKYGVRSRAELLALAGVRDVPAFFSARELDVSKRMEDGLTDAQIAAILFISTNTVRSHIHNMCAKCNALLSCFRMCRTQKNRKIAME